MATVIKLKRDATDAEMDAIKQQTPPQKKGIDLSKYCGVIKLTEDPVAFQKRIRDEWE